MIRRIAGTPLYVIVLINLLLKLGMFCYISPWNKTVADTKILVSDSKGYEDVAENLLQYHAFAPLKDTIDINKFSEYKATGFLGSYRDSWMMPGYPIFLASVYSIVGINPFIAIFIQIIISLISVVLVYRIGSLLFVNSKVATIAALLFALDIHSIYSANELLTDTLYVLLFLASIYYFLKGMLGGKLTIFFLGVIFLGLAFLTRIVALVYPVVLIIILIFFSKQDRKWKVKAMLSYILVFVSLSGMWSFRNHSQYQHWELTTHDGWTLLMSNASITKARITHEDLDSVRVFFQKEADSIGFRKSKDIFDQSKMYKIIASNYIMKHKGMYLFTTLQGSMNMFLSLGNRGMAKTFGWTDTKPGEDFAEFTPRRIWKNFSSNARETILGILILLILALQYLGAIYGIIKLRLARNFMLISLIVLTIAYYTGITGILGNYRLKLPVVPLICIAAGYGYANLKSKNKEGSLQQTQK